ncbi:MAG: nitronate monooxygenase [Eubacteriales bacterium]
MRLNTLLGTKYSIIQGAMANISTGEFAANVSNAGGLGIIASGGMDGPHFREQIQSAKAHTNKPFGVNIMLMNPCADDLAQIAIEEQVAVITTGAGNPSKYMTSWKEAGILVFPVVASVALAKRMEKLGADGVIAEGTESGGHVGELTTMALLPQVINAVSIPVVAAGGIASGPQMAAVLTLGACGVQVGTCLLVSEECPIHDNYKLEIIKAKDTSTIVTGRSVGVPVRVLKNPMSREYVKLEHTVEDKMELEKLTLGSLRKAVVEGDVQGGSFMAGQVAGQLTQIHTLADILEDLESSCKESLSNMRSYYED